MSCSLFVFILIIIDSIAKQPNIIFILGDDIGYDDIGFQSDSIITPNLDKLKANGQFIPYHYAQCVCSPTRGSLLTGLYPLHNGINTVLVRDDTYGLSLNFTLLPEILLNNGYDTHMVGKWHLGYYKWEYTPTFRGFKSWLGYYTGAEDYYTHKNGYYDMHDDIGLNCGSNCSRIPTELYNVYSTTAFTNRAIDVIKNHTLYENDKPLFLYIAYQTGHYPDACPQEYIDMNKNISDIQRRLYAGMITCMDEGIGNITNILEEYGYLNDDGNTIIIFSSDNGAPVPMGNVTQDGTNGGYNWPLRGGKDSIWEGGTRVTSLIWGTKDIIPYTQRGMDYTQLMHISDWFPTILNAANIDINNINLNYNLDGISHWNGIIGNYSSNIDPYFEYRNDIYYGYEVDPLFKFIGYRYGWYKILNDSGGFPMFWYPPPELNHKIILNNPNVSVIPLFNLYDDPNEYYDISLNNQNIVQQLNAQMIAIKQTGIPQSVGETGCPNQTFPVYPVVGGVLLPWCS